MKFNDHTDGWFDALTEWSDAHREDALPLIEAVKKTPTKLNVERLAFEVRKMALAYSQADGNPQRIKAYATLCKLHAHCEAVLNKSFKKEFRFSFGGKGYPSSSLVRVSKASCLFSAIGQSLEYNEKLTGAGGETKKE